jgi:hypothetical protein
MRNQLLRFLGKAPASAGKPVRARLGVERLDARELPSAGPLQQILGWPTLDLTGPLQEDTTLHSTFGEITTPIRVERVHGGSEVLELVNILT